MALRARCHKCGDVIPQARLEILPDATTCVHCSDVKARTVRDVDLDGADPRDMIRAVQYPDRG